MTPVAICVPSIDYALGLADVIGEYRRLALDNLRDGEVKKAEECLEVMDQIFIQLLALDEAYMLVPGLGINLTTLEDNRNYPRRRNLGSPQKIP